MPVDFLTLCGVRTTRRARAIRGIIAEHLTEAYEIPEGRQIKDLLLDIRREPGLEDATVHPVYYHYRALRIAYRFYHAEETERQVILSRQREELNPLRVLREKGIESWKQVMEQVARTLPPSPAPPPEPLAPEELSTVPITPPLLLPDLVALPYREIERFGETIALVLELAQTQEARIHELQKQYEALRKRQEEIAVVTLEELGQRVAPVAQLLAEGERIRESRRQQERERLRALFPRRSKHHNADFVCEDRFLDSLAELSAVEQNLVVKAVELLGTYGPSEAKGLRTKKPEPGEVLGITTTEHTRLSYAAEKIRFVWDLERQPERVVRLRAVDRREGAYK